MAIHFPSSASLQGSFMVTHRTSSGSSQVFAFMLVVVFTGAGLVGGWFANKFFGMNAELRAHDNDDEHGHQSDADGNSLILTDQARRNIDLKLARLELQDFPRTISLPGRVAERPGRTALHIPAPFAGVVSKIFVEPGIAVQSGDDLFQLTLTHEDLVQAQSSLLQTVEEMDVTKSEISRLNALTALAGKTLLERQYELQKLEATLRSQREALLLHGLSETQVGDIISGRKLLRSIIVRVPWPETSDKDQRITYQVESLPVELGKHVDSGADLICLADHELLVIEGNAFEQDLPELQRLMEENHTLTATFDSNREKPRRVTDLKLNYLAPTVNNESRTVAFYVWLPNELLKDEDRDGRRIIDWKYRPGQRVELEVPVEVWKDELVVPMAAVSIDGPESYIFQVDGDRFVRRPVHVRYRTPQVAVLANDGSVFAGDLIAVSGAQQLQIALKNKASGPIDPHAGHSH